MLLMIHCRQTYCCEVTLGGTHDVLSRSLIKFFQRYYTSGGKYLLPLRDLGDHTIKTLMVPQMHFGGVNYAKFFGEHVRHQ